MASYERQFEIALSAASEEITVLKKKLGTEEEEHEAKMAEWATTFVSIAPEVITEVFASIVEAAVDTEVKEEQIKNHLLQDQSVVQAGLTENQAKVVTASFKGLAETMKGEMLAMLRKELGLGAKEAVKKEEEEGGAYTNVPKGGCKAGQASSGSRRRADADSIIDDSTERTGAAKRAGGDISKDEQQARGSVVEGGEGAAPEAGITPQAAGAEMIPQMQRSADAEDEL